jgi:competence protein ComEC
MQTPDASSPTKLDSLATRLPLMWLSLAFLTGILFANRVSLPFLFWLILTLLVVAGAVLVRLFPPRSGFQPLGLPASSWFLVLLALSAFCSGAFRYQVSQPKVDASHVAWYNDREFEVLVTGTLVEPPDERDTYTNLRIAVSSVDTGGSDLPVGGLLLARILPGTDLHYGDVVRVRGHLQTPPANEDFSYHAFLARQGIHAIMTEAVVTRLPFRGGNFFLRWVYGFKAVALERIYAIFPDPEASLLAGILLGEDNGLSADLQQAFNNTGTSHIIAISGFNMAIIAALFVVLFSRLLGPRRGAAAAIAGIVLYTILVGADASVVRAAIMGSLVIFARQVGRRQTAINTLAFTAAVMCILNPYTPWDVGFQLSVFATLGILLYAQPFQEWATRMLARRVPMEKAQKIAKPIAEFVLLTLAAQLTTLPIMAWHFQRISLVSLIANPFILPAQPLVMILGGSAVLLALLFLPLGQVFAWVVWPFSAYTIHMVELFNRLPHGVIVLGDFSILFVLAFYAILFGYTFSPERVKQTLRTALTPAFVLTILGVLTFLVWRSALLAPDGRLHITFLDVGSADAVLIQTPSGESILINGGSSPTALADGLGRRLSPLDRSLNWLVVASPQEEQVAALPRILDRFPPESVLWAGNVEASLSARELDRQITDRGIPLTRAVEGMVFDLGDGARLEVLTVSERGAVLLVEWGSFRLLLPIGANYDSLEKLDQGQEIGPVTALLLADSGFAQLNPPGWLDALDPQVVILSVAAGDANGLPDQLVLDALTGVTLLRTDQNGWVEVITDGEGLWVAVGKK